MSADETSLAGEWFNPAPGPEPAESWDTSNDYLLRLRELDEEFRLHERAPMSSAVYASWGRRFVAWLLDSIIVGAYPETTNVLLPSRRP